MKIGTPELKTKPATKYFDGGYIRFYTVDKTLWYAIHRVTKTSNQSLSGGTVTNDVHLKQLLAIKNLSEAIAQ